MNEIAIATTTAPVEQAFTQAHFDRWIAYLDAGPKTTSTYIKAVGRFFSYAHTQGITAPTRADIIAYRGHLLASCKPTTVQLYMVALRLFFRWLNQETGYPNVADKIKGAKLDTEHKKDYLTSRQVQKVLKSIDKGTLRGKRDYAMLFLMVSTGLRTVEVSRACMEDMRSLGDFTALYVQGKGHAEKGAYVKVEEPVEAAIREYLAARKAGPKGPLFASTAHRNTGAAMDPCSVSRVVKERLIGAGFNSDRLTAHSLRHTAATIALLNGAKVEEAQQMLRHKNIATTLIYSHAIERAKNNTEGRIVAAIAG